MLLQLQKQPQQQQSKSTRLYHTCNNSILTNEAELETQTGAPPSKRRRQEKAAGTTSKTVQPQTRKSRTGTVFGISEVPLILSDIVELVEFKLINVVFIVSL